MIELLRANRFIRFAALYGAISVLLFGILGFILHQVVENIREDTGLLERREEIARSFEKLLTDLRETEEARQALFLVRLHPREIVSLVRGLESAAARSFIEQKISAQRSVVPSGDGGYVSPVVRYQVNLLGPWEKVEAYLEKLHELPHLVRVEGIQMSTDPSGDLLQQGQTDIVFAVAVLDPSAEVPESQRALNALIPSPGAPVPASPSPSPIQSP